jgi:hypothetical protein
LRFARDFYSAKSKLRKHLATAALSGDPALTHVSDAVSQLCSRVEERRDCSSELWLRDTTRYGLWQKDESSLSPAEAVQEAFCGAIASYLGPKSLCSHDFEYSAPTALEFPDLRSQFWQCLAACYVGDISVLTDIKRSLPTESKRSNMPLREYAWVSIAARRGHVQVVRFLLEDVSDQSILSTQTSTAILAAVEGRCVEVLEVLLKRGAATLSQDLDYQKAVRSAVCIRDRDLRWSFLLLFTDDDRRKLSQKTRDDVFYLATRNNDVETASWAMQHGVIDFFKFARGYPPNYKNPLTGAIHNDHLEVMRLILDNMDAFKLAQTPLEMRKRQASLREAYEAACRTNKLEPFMALAKRIGGPEEAFLQAARVEGALSRVEDLTGSVDVGKEYTRTSYPGETLGEHALYNAVRAMQVVNIRLLLARGCRLGDESRSIGLQSWIRRKAEDQPSLHLEVIAVLADHGMNVELEL